MKKESKVSIDLRVGIDIGSNSIKLVETRGSGKEVVIEYFDLIPIPAEKDSSKKTQIIAKLLKGAFSNLSNEPRSIYSLISGPDVVIKRVSFPKMSDEDLLEAIKWEMRNHISFPLENASIDYYPLKESSNVSGKNDILVVAVKKDMLEASLAAFEAADIKLDGLSVAPFAAWDILKKLDVLQKDKTTALVLVGSETTRVTFFNGDNLEFYREFSLAGNTFTKALIGLFVADKWQMDLSYEQAENIKKLYGIPDDNTTENTVDGIPLIQILQILKPVLRRFINELIRSFSYYKEQFGKENIDKIFISGGSSKLKNLSAAISQELGAKIEDLSDLIKFAPGKNIKDENKLAELLPHLTKAIGISISGEPSINLLKKPKRSFGLEMPFDMGKFTQNFDPESLKNTPAVIASIVFFFMLIIGTMTAVITNKNIESYNKTLADKKVLLGELQKLSGRKAILAKVESEKGPIKEAIAELTNLMPDNSYLNSLLFDSKQNAFLIEGFCKNMISVSDLIKKVERSSFFSKTTLLEARKSSPDKGMNFKLAFNLQL